MAASDHLNEQQFSYHGTDQALNPGDMITPGHKANFENSDPSKVYFSGDPFTAYKYADHAMRLHNSTTRAIYQVDTPKTSEADPFDAPWEKSYQTTEPLRVIRKLDTDEALGYDSK